MTYELGFLEPALKEWHKLDASTRDQSKNKLVDRLDNPHVVAARLSGSNHRYKIKLKSVCYRLVYEVRDQQLLVIDLPLRFSSTWS